MIVFLVLVLVTMGFLQRLRAPRTVMQRLGILLAVLLAQAGVGYAQYFNDIPPLLVGIHIAGATAVWAAVVAFYLGLFTVTPARSPAAAGTRTLAGTGAGRG